MRFIAEAVGVSRRSVDRVLARGTEVVPRLDRESALDGELERVRGLYAACRGNVVRVHEELNARGLAVSYTTLTRFCRVHGIGGRPKERVGRHDFEPGEEMQHDTSPHDVVVGGRQVRLVCASVVLCYSRVRYIRCYHRFNRFVAKIFLTEALKSLGGSAEECMLDNSTVIMEGTGRDARAVPEMAAFSDRFGFTFVSHVVGDAKRSGRVERPFHHVENNFYVGRTFRDLDDLNEQLAVWCATWSGTPNKTFGFVPVEMWALERSYLAPLPAYIPEPREVHPRKVSVEGFVWLHKNRYSAPTELIGMSIEVHETKDKVELYRGPRLVCAHEKREDGAAVTVTLPEHEHRWRALRPPVPSPAELALRATGSASLHALCDVLRADHGGQALRSMTRLYRLWTELPAGALEVAATRALEFGLTDIDRIERMALRQVRGEFFRIPTGDGDG